MSQAEIPEEFDLAGLAHRATMPVRTLRYYQQLGLLRKAGIRGPGARYSQGDLNRLILISALQKDRLPLDEIRKSLDLLTDDGVEKALGRASRSFASYEQYLQAVLGEGLGQHASAADYARAVREGVQPLFGLDTALTPPSAESPTRGARSKRSTWERHELTPNIELHLRKPMSRHEQRLVDELRALARRLHRHEEEQHR
jgi:DNA-binding transcriptional MerR regulator